MRDALDDAAVLRAVLDKSSEMTAISDTSGRVLYINAAGLALVGLTELSLVEPVTTAQFLSPSGLDFVGEVQWALRHAREWHGPAEVKNFATNFRLRWTVYVLRRRPLPRRRPASSCRWLGIAGYRAGRPDSVAGRRQGIELPGRRTAGSGELEQARPRRRNRPATRRGDHGSLDADGRRPLHDHPPHRRRRRRSIAVGRVHRSSPPAYRRCPRDISR